MIDQPGHIVALKKALQTMALTQVRCYIDSPRFDEKGEVTEMVDDILKRMP